MGYSQRCVHDHRPLSLAAGLFLLQAERPIEHLEFSHLRLSMTHIGFVFYTNTAQIATEFHWALGSCPNLRNLKTNPPLMTSTVVCMTCARTHGRKEKETLHTEGVRVHVCTRTACACMHTHATGLNIHDQCQMHKARVNRVNRSKQTSPCPRDLPRSRVFAPFEVQRWFARETCSKHKENARAKVKACPEIKALATTQRVDVISC